MVIKTSNTNAIKPYLKKIPLPAKDSHKGQNGKLLIIGGSTLFHAASLWAADIASKIVDMVHYSSTVENEKIFVSLKSKFLNGIVIKKQNLLHYIKEDDCVLLGPGFVRGEVENFDKLISLSFDQIVKLDHEPSYTIALSYYLLKNFPNQKFVIDAGSLQMMKKEWLLKLKTKAIVTPHQKEFEQLFAVSMSDKSFEEKVDLTHKMAKHYNCIILLKAVSDIISDGIITIIIEGGNPGLTKGGTGDVLAGITASLVTKSDPLTSCVVASFLLKKSAEILYQTNKFWFNTSDVINQIPKTLTLLKKTKTDQS